MSLRGAKGLEVKHRENMARDIPTPYQHPWKRCVGRRLFLGYGAGRNTHERAETMIRKTLAALTLAAIFGNAFAAADPEHLPPGGASILTWTPEQQAWGYKNMEKLAPFRLIKRGEKVHALPTGAAIEVRFTAGDKTYDTAGYMREFRASGVLVIKNGKIVLERYGLGRTANDRWTSFFVAES